MKNKKYYIGLLIIWILLSGLSLYLATRSNLIHSNYSDLLTSDRYRYGVYLWSLMNGFSLCSLVYLSNPNELKNKVILCFVMWLIATCCPYAPAQHPLLSSLHIILAYICFCFINGLIIYSIYLLGQKDILKANQIMSKYFLLLGLHGLYFMIMGGINSIFEASYTITLNGFLLVYVYHLNKNK
ncbi:MAG: hypothetical protein R3Y57_03595 [Erysipelotrichaceae bacterium]